MKKHSILCVVIISFLLTGCAQYWYQEGESYQQCLKDREICFSELNKRSDFVGTGDYEFEYMAQCMQEKGYRLVEEKELPMDVKRAQPDSTIHWRVKGVAGTVE
ncbi:MAG: hypothetical protein ACYTEU_00970 [Planctomycetota bacterium]|jgi:hypothetical protein